MNKLPLHAWILTTGSGLRIGMGLDHNGGLSGNDIGHLIHSFIHPLRLDVVCSCVRLAALCLLGQGQVLRIDVWLDGAPENSR